MLTHLCAYLSLCLLGSGRTCLCAYFAFISVPICLYVYTSLCLLVSAPACLSSLCLPVSLPTYLVACFSQCLLVSSPTHCLTYWSLCLIVSLPTRLVAYSWCCLRVPMPTRLGAYYLSMPCCDNKLHVRTNARSAPLHATCKQLWLLSGMTVHKSNFKGQCFPA